MRVITGLARGRRLETLPGEVTRPTSEKVKESLFSAIQFDIEGRRVLDLFAGSGQLGIEALSRGASGCVFVDKNTEAVKIIRQNLQHTGLSAAAQVLGTDALTYLTRPGDRFDLVFLDPPYALGVIPKVLARLQSDRLLEAGARIVCESAAEEDVFGGDEELRNSFEILRTARYGAAFVTILAPKSGEVEA